MEFPTWFLHNLALMIEIKEVPNNELSPEDFAKDIAIYTSKLTHKQQKNQSSSSKVPMVIAIVSKDFSNDLDLALSHENIFTWRKTDGYDMLSSPREKEQFIASQLLGSIFERPIEINAKTSTEPTFPIRSSSDDSLCSDDDFEAYIDLLNERGG